MFWVALFLFSLALVFVQLGALSVWVTVLLMVVKLLAVLAVVAIATVAVRMFWKHYKARQRPKVRLLTLK